MLNRVASLTIQEVSSKPCLVNMISKDPHLVFSIGHQLFESAVCNFNVASMCMSTIIIVQPCTLNPLPKEAKQFEPRQVISNNVAF